MNGVRMTDEEVTQAYLTYHDMVYRIAIVKMRDRAKAEDIQQEVFMAMIRYSDRIRNEEHLKAWLIRVTLNACRKRFRGFWERMTVFLDDQKQKRVQQEDTGQADEEPGDTTGDPALAYEEDLNPQLTREAVEGLSPGSQAVVHLRFYEQLSIKEIAYCLGLSEAAVKTRISRAYTELRKTLEGQIRL